MSKKPLFLVYTDNPMCSIDCADAVCDVLNYSGFYEARLVGPSSEYKTPLTKELLKKSSCVVFGGGMGDADQFDKKLIHLLFSLKKF